MPGYSDEAQRLKDLRKIIGRPSKRVILGAGDDATVTISPKRQLITAVHTLIEGVHFDLHYTSPTELGYKALSVTLSNIAAMGAAPLYATVSVGIRQELSEIFLRELYRGLALLARNEKVDLVGSELADSPSFLVLHVVVQGQPVKNILTRRGARVGDMIALTGPLGGSGAGLEALKKMGRQKLADYPELIRAHLMPEPRTKEGAALAKSGVITSMMDIADSLTRDLHTLLQHSKVGCLIDETLLPVSETAKKGAELLGTSASRYAFYGSEDHELIVTLHPKNLNKANRSLRFLKKELLPIGEVKPDPHGFKLQSRGGEIIPLEAREYHNFVRRQKVS